jgi:voltage-gated potassium channel
MAQEPTSRGELKDTGYEIFIAALSLLSIVNLVLVWLIQEEALKYVLFVMDGLLSLVLLGDFLYRLVTAESRSEYFLRRFGWADLLASLPFAQLKFLRAFRLMRVYRLMRARGARHIILSLIRDRAGSALFSLLLIAILVLEFGSLAMLRAEQAAPDGNIETASDALWYLLVTMSTVGYGDQFPVTSTGRVLGSVVIIIGVGIFGTLTGFLANAFLGAPAESDEEGATEVAADRGSAQVDTSTPRDESDRLEHALIGELEELREQHRSALERIDRMLSENR